MTLEELMKSLDDAQLQSLQRILESQTTFQQWIKFSGEINKVVDQELENRLVALRGKS